MVGPGTAKKVADEALAIWGGASRQTSQPTETYQADKEKAKEIAAKNKQAIKSKQKVSKVQLALKTISNVFIPLSAALIASGYEKRRTLLSGHSRRR